LANKKIESEFKMTHVVITVRNDGEEDAPAIRSKDYKDKADACADVEDIMKFIGSHI
jgi:hypothetical protein